MWRSLALTLLLLTAAPQVRAQTGPWEVCRPGPEPAVSDCRRLAGPANPQGRELWLRTPVAAPKDDVPRALHIFGTASSRAWFNGTLIGANGRPGRTAAEETPGRYEAVLPIPQHLWRAEGNELVLQMSSFHAGLRLATPIGGIFVAPFPQPSRLPLLAVTLVAAGALAASAFGFAAIHAMRRTGSSLILAALAAVAALHAVTESLRHLWRYDYPVHVWRVGAIWVLSVAFAILLVAWASGRFLPRGRVPLLWAAALAVPASYLAPGFDMKTGIALLTGVALAGAAALGGVLSHRPGARSVLAWLMLFAGLGLVQPYWLIDLSMFVLAAALTLALLVAEVLRLSRDDRDREAALTQAASRPNRLTVAGPRGVELAQLEDIVAVVGADDYVELRMAGGRVLLHSARLDRLEAQLPEGFIRAHRSAIANLSHVRRLELEGQRWRLHMSEGPPLPVSRSRLPAVRAALDPAAARYSFGGMKSAAASPANAMGVRSSR